MSQRPVKLTDDERALLQFFLKNEEYQVNTWAIPDDVGDLWRRGSDLQSLKRRGLLDAEGRGNTRQWWITDKGKEVLA